MHSGVTPVQKCCALESAAMHWRQEAKGFQKCLSPAVAPQDSGQAWLSIEKQELMTSWLEDSSDVHIANRCHPSKVSKRPAAKPLNCINC
jgi:hypothetical protein